LNPLPAPSLSRGFTFFTGLVRFELRHGVKAQFGCSPTGCRPSLQNEARNGHSMFDWRWQSTLRRRARRERDAVLAVTSLIGPPALSLPEFHPSTAALAVAETFFPRNST